MPMMKPLLAGTLALVMANGPALAAGGDTAAQKAPAATSDADKVICRKTLETGSLVKKNKQCFTKAEWDKIYAAHREGNEKTRDQLSGRCGVNGGEGCTM